MNTYEYIRRTRIWEELSVRTVIENYYLRKEMTRAGDFPLTTVWRKIVAEKNIGEKIASRKDFAR